MVCPIACVPPFVVKALWLLLLVFVIALAARAAFYVLWNKAFGFRAFGGIFLLMTAEWLIGFVAVGLLIAGALWIFGESANPLMHDLRAVVHCITSLRTCHS